MAMSEKATQPVGGWTTWCQSARGIPREPRNPVRKTAPEKSSMQETRHAG